MREEVTRDQVYALLLEEPFPGLPEAESRMRKCPTEKILLTLPPKRNDLSYF